MAASTEDRIWKLEAKLAYRNRFEELITEISTRFIVEVSADLDGELARSLEQVGRFADVDRAYIFRFSRDLRFADNSHEWCAEGIAPQIEQLQGLETIAFGSWMERFEQRENVFVPDVEDLEDSTQRRFLSEQGIRSLIAVPMVVGEELFGFAGFDWVRAVTTWSADEVRLLRLVADVFANAIQRARTDHELERARSELQKSQRLDAIGRLAGGIAHDFNNLLTTIVGHGDALRERIGDDPEAREHLETLLRGGESAASLVRQLLEFSRNREVQKEAVDLDEIVARTVELVSPILQPGIETELQLGDAGWVQVNPGQLEQVLLNVLTNARDAMPHGGRLVVGTRPATTEEERDGVLLAVLIVRDEGVGMSEDVLAHVFDPFFTTKEEGTGLGLASVYGIVEQSGGRIEIWSRSGVGTEVRILLPAADEPEDDSRVELVPTGRETVLLVDDEPAIVELLATVLRDRGYRVLEAKDVETALAAARAERIDLVVTDLVLSAATGFEVIDRLEALQGPLPSLLMSGYGPEEMERHGREPDPSALIQKPFSPNELLRRVRRVLDSA